jgi:prepilin-type N-terminal cleavage/methylation domain-containing protein
MKFSANKRQRGLTLTELLVVMVIIGLLSTIIVPVYVNRMEEARVKVAMGECREIAEAEDQCALIHGYYVPFQVLDDRPKYYYPFGPLSPAGDFIDREDQSSIFLINPLIRPDLQLAGANFQPQLNSTTNQRVIDMRERWQGPFLNPQRVYTGTEDPKDPNFVNSVMIHLDFPMDPWGQPYRFYSPLGVIGSNALQTDLSNLNINFSNGLLTNNDDRDFQKYAVVSFGRDNERETLVGQQNRDDVIYTFGISGVESTFALY